jgi:dihydroflavonol-4-reductase
VPSSDVFLTGGSGFIGGAILDRLVADGRRVRALVRSEESADKVRVAGAEPVFGDLKEEGGDWQRAVEGCGVVYHVAGKVTMCGHPEATRVNVRGTRAVVAAAAAAGVDRVVYTSSGAAIGERPGEMGTEDTIHSGEYLSRYARSKHRAELAAFDEADRRGVDVVSVNPSSVQGPGRTHGTARLFIAYLRGRLRWAVHARIPIVSIGDTVEAHVLAEQRGKPGERYLVNGWNPTVEEMVATLAGITGEERRVRYVPGWLFTGIAAVVELGAKVVRKRPPICRELARTMQHGHVFDGSKSERDLGLEYTPPEVWLAETVEWYRKVGVV